MSEIVNASRWYDGVSVPNKFLGNNGDYYLQIPNSDIFRKTEDVWIRIGNIRGLKGDRGYKGDIGLAGTNGLNGSEWFDGVGAPSHNLGKEKDYYIDVVSKDIFSKVSNNWERVGSLLPDGRKIELRSKDGNIEYRYEGEDERDWRVLILNTEIKGEKGDTPSITHLELEINNKISSVNSIMETHKNNETERQNNEAQRKIEEEERSDSEKVRNVNESKRVQDETARRTQEEARVRAENTRESSESTRRDNEVLRLSGEESRVLKEGQRELKEQERQSKEQAREIAEIARISGESLRTTNEETRKSSENTRKLQETQRQQSVNNMQSKINTKVEEVEGRMKHIEDTFDGLVDGTGFATKDYVTNKIEDLEIGGGNFILNSAFLNQENSYSSDGSIRINNGVAEITDATHLKMDLGSSFGALRRGDNVTLSSIATLYPKQANETVGLNKFIGGNINIFSENYTYINESVSKLKLNMITVPLVVSIENETSSNPVVEEWALNRTKAYLTNLRDSGAINKYTRLIFEPHPLISGGNVGETHYNPSDKAEFFEKWKNIIINGLTQLSDFKFYGIYIGTNFELFDTGEENIPHWTKLSRDLRSLYKNHQLIYRTNWWITASWDEELKRKYEEKVNNPIWDNVDIISIASYFELNEKAIPTVDELYKDLTEGTSVFGRKQNVYAEVKKFYDTWKKPIMFGELGCPSKEFGAKSPWSNLTSNIDNQNVQANLIEAYNRVFIYKNDDFNNDWFLGYSIFTLGSTASEFDVVDKEAQRNVNSGINFIESNTSAFIACTIKNKITNGTIADLKLPLSAMMENNRHSTTKITFDGADNCEIVFSLPSKTTFKITKPMLASGTKPTAWCPSPQDTHNHDANYYIKKQIDDLFKAVNLEIEKIKQQLDSIVTPPQK